MKRLLLTALVVIACSDGFAQKVKIDKIKYGIENGEAFVYKADENIEVANIPSTIEYKGKSYTVTKIGEPDYALTGQNAFTECDRLSSVSIPNTVKRIEGGAFAYCKNLREISIPNSVEFIGHVAFGASGLRKIILPDKPIKINREKKPVSIPSNIWYRMPFVRNGILNVSSFSECDDIEEVKCQDGSFPKYIVAYLPEECPLMNELQARKIEQDMFAQDVQPQIVQPTPDAEKKKPSSDVDVNLPSNAQNNEKTFAVIFANEDYSEEEDVEYAHNDGEMFKEYCHKVLGMPEDNVHIRKDATLNHIKAEISWMQQVAKAYNGQARFIIFYAGHGIPDEKSATAYLLPVDGKGTMLDTGYSLAKFYEALAAMPAERVTVFMDACFSGSKRGDGMLASARGVAIKAKAQTPKGKMVVFSAAQGDETAYPLKDKEHGLFTYYLLKKLKETKGNVTYGELGDYITQQVSRKSIVANGKSQKPTVTPSQTIAASWKTMKLR